MDTEVLKVCIRCGATKPLSGFKNRPSSPDGKRNDCRACSWERERVRRERPEIKARILEVQKVRRLRDYTPEKGRDANLRGKYGITAAEVEQMELAQGGTCAICAGPPQTRYPGRLVVDHCHTSGAGRGLLCTSCNQALGLFEDNLESLSSAIDYLRKHRVG